MHNSEHIIRWRTSKSFILHELNRRPICLLSSGSGVRVSPGTLPYSSRNPPFRHHPPIRFCRADCLLSCAQCLFGHMDHWTPDPKVGGPNPLRHAITNSLIILKLQAFPGSPPDSIFPPCHNRVTDLPHLGPQDMVFPRAFLRQSGVFPESCTLRPDHPGISCEIHSINCAEIEQTLAQNSSVKRKRDQTIKICKCKKNKLDTLQQGRIRRSRFLSESFLKSGRPFSNELIPKQRARPLGLCY